MTFRSGPSLILVCVCVLVAACKKKKPIDPEVRAQLPVIVTGVPANITHNSAELTCFLSSQGSAPVTEMGICWDTIPEPTIATTKVSSSNQATEFTCTMTGIKRGSRYPYYVRAYATNAAGTSYGKQYTVVPPNRWYSAGPSITTKATCLSSSYQLLIGTENKGLYSMSFTSGELLSEELNATGVRAIVESGTPSWFAATAQGIFVLSGLSGWQPSNAGLDNLNISTLVKTDDNFFALAGGQVYSRLPMMSVNWSKLDFTGITVTRIWGTDKGGGLVIYDKAANKIHWSTTSGSISSSGNSPAPDILDMNYFNDVLYLGASDGAYFSKDHGLTWTKVSDPNISGHAVNCFSKNRSGLCAAVGANVYMAKPSDSWPELCPGLPAGLGAITHMHYANSLYVYQWDGTSGNISRVD